MQETLDRLQWYIDAGVDEAIEEAPRDWFARSEAQEARNEAVKTVAVPLPSITGSQPIDRHPSSVDSRPSTPASLPLHHSLAAAIAEARRLADEATTREALEAAVRGFDGCAIKRTATKTVFCDGNPAARIMLIGEAPGAQEDAQGIPFCGPSGWLLDKMMAAIGYDRTNFYITNTVFWRPPGNRQPNAEELAICKPFVERHVALIDPKLVVLVGGTSAKAVLGTETGITRLRGKSYSYRSPYADKDYPVSVIYHPSYLLRQPAHKRATWADLLAIKAQMENFGA